LGQKTSLWGKEDDEQPIEDPTVVYVEKLWNLLLL